MNTENLLIELGTEELPPKALKKLAVAFKNNIEAQLTAAELTFDSIEWFAAPRRLAVRVNNLVEQQADKQVEKRGPAVQAAFDADGNPTKAAMGWARGCGIEVSEAGRHVTDKGEWLLHTATVAGKNIAELVEGFIAQALKLGVTHINNIRFSSSRLQEYQDKARVMAAQQAKAKAKSIAKVLDVKVLKPLTIHLGRVHWTHDQNKQVMKNNYC